MMSACFETITCLQLIIINSDDSENYINCAAETALINNPRIIHSAAYTRKNYTCD
jgi:hypothetical protein